MKDQMDFKVYFILNNSDDVNPIESIFCKDLYIFEKM